MVVVVVVVVIKKQSQQSMKLDRRRSVLFDVVSASPSSIVVYQNTE